MTIFLINLNTKQRVEILDNNLEFFEDQIFAVPKWNVGKMRVKEVVFLASVSGENASLSQNIYCEEMEEEK